MNCGLGTLSAGLVKLNFDGSLHNGICDAGTGGLICNTIVLLSLPSLVHSMGENLIHMGVWYVCCNKGAS